MIYEATYFLIFYLFLVKQPLSLIKVCLLRQWRSIIINDKLLFLTLLYITQMGNNCFDDDKIINDVGLDTSRFSLPAENKVCIKKAKYQLIDASHQKQQSQFNQRVRQKSLSKAKAVQQRDSIVSIYGIPQPQKQDIIIRKHLHQPIKQKEVKSVSLMRINETEYQQCIKPQRLWTQKLIRKAQIQDDRKTKTEINRNSVMDAIQSGKFRYSIFTKNDKGNLEQNQASGIQALKFQSIQQRSQENHE